MKKFMFVCGSVFLLSLASFTYSCRPIIIGELAQDKKSCNKAKAKKKISKPIARFFVSGHMFFGKWQLDEDLLKLLKKENEKKG